MGNVNAMEVLYGNEGTKIVPPAAVGEVMSNAGVSAFTWSIGAMRNIDATRASEATRLNILFICCNSPWGYAG